MVEKTYGYYLNMGKTYFVKKDYLSAQMYFIKASELNPEFVSGKFKKLRELGQIARNDYRQECLNQGIFSILNDIDDSIVEENSQNIFNPYNRDFNLKQTQTIALLKDYLFILHCCLKESSKSKYWAYGYKLMGDIHVKLEQYQFAYSCYKKSLYFNKNMGVKPIFKKLAKKLMNEDKINDSDFKYSLINNIYFQEQTAIINKESKSRQCFDLDGKSVSVEELCRQYYKRQGYDAIHGENYFWWFTSNLFFKDLSYIDLEYSSRVTYQCRNDTNIYLEEFTNPNFEIYGLNDPQSYLDELNNRIHEYCKTDSRTFVKKYYNINGEYGTDYIKILGFNKFFSILNSMGFEKCLELSKELASHDPQKLPTSGFPDLIVWDENEFFFVEVKSTKDKLSERQKWWHLYISEKLEIPIVIFMVNKNEKQINAIKKQYFIK